jgi:hypothetical protein
MNVLFPYRHKIPIQNFSGEKTRQRRKTNQIDTIGTNGKNVKLAKKRKQTVK